ncbi:MAG TPA: hypothetical protein VI603_18690 [Saprospiraceae bacterium]|nr:hypothetical protein [Saprospiraceae bacterium]
MKHLLFAIAPCMMCTLINNDILAQLTVKNIPIAQEFRQPMLRERNVSHGRSLLVVTPALHVAHVPSMTEDWMTLDIGDVVVAPYRPRISIRKPLVIGPQSAIVIEPGEDTPYMRITNFGSSGTDGIKILYGDDFPASFVFNLTYDVIQGKESIDYGNDLSEIVLTRTYDKATPKLSEKISSGNIGVNSFFDISYDITSFTEKRIVGDVDLSVALTRTYDKATPKLSEKISSDNIGVNSFFDISYDLESLVEKKFTGDLNEHILITRTYDKSTPKLEEKISSGNMDVDNFFLTTYDLPSLTSTSKGGDLAENVVISLSYDKATPKLKQKISSENVDVNSFFDITYDIALGKETIMHGDPDFDLLLTRTYDKVTPKLEEKISSGNIDVDNFFLTSYDLPTLTATSKGGDLTESVIFTRTYDKATPKLQEAISSENIGVNSFFDITYDIEALTERRKGGGLDSNIIVTRTYDKATPKLEEKISSGNIGVDNIFLTSYDLPMLTATSKGGNLTESVIFTRTYDKATPKLLEKISSGNVGATSFFDITWDLSQASRPLHELAFVGEGLVPMRKQTDCEILTRIINERYAEDGGLSHTIEHRMTPDPITGTSMWVLLGGGMENSFLRINGGGAPFSIMNTGNVFSDGNMEITGILTVNGGKMFKIDHPLDPDNKYLIHSCVESPDMMNIYNGNVTTDANGFAQVLLPDYFEALNEEFRYQLTCIGQFAQAIIAEKISDNKFTIQTDKPNVEVSWQVTGVRHDPAALKYKQPVEALKKR